MAEKYVFMFTETDETMRNLVGGKGANPWSDEPNWVCPFPKDSQYRLKPVHIIIRMMRNCPKKF